MISLRIPPVHLPSKGFADAGGIQLYSLFVSAIFDIDQLYSLFALTIFANGSVQGPQKPVAQRGTPEAENLECDPSGFP